MAPPFAAVGELERVEVVVLVMVRVTVLAIPERVVRDTSIMVLMATCSV